MNIIVARGMNGEIGANNELMWKLPTDMKFFMDMTVGNTVVMGRNTRESLGEKPLPNRLNIVISRGASTLVSNYGNVKYMRMDTFRWWIENYYSKNTHGEVFIIGGKMLYEEFANSSKVMYITDIAKTFEIADTVVHLDTEGMIKTPIYKGMENGLDFEINRWERK